MGINCRKLRDNHVFILTGSPESFHQSLNPILPIPIIHIWRWDDDPVWSLGTSSIIPNPPSSLLLTFPEDGCLSHVIWNPDWSVAPLPPYLELVNFLPWCPCLCATKGCLILDLNCNARQTIDRRLRFSDRVPSDFISGNQLDFWWMWLLFFPPGKQAPHKSVLHCSFCTVRARAGCIGRCYWSWSDGLLERVPAAHRWSGLAFWFHFHSVA